jgi:methylamine dehydrogenase light chain
MRSLDQLFEHSSRSLARRTSRRSMLATLGQVLTGAALLPLLPIDRAGRAHAAEAKTKGVTPESCDYWK